MEGNVLSLVKDRVKQMFRSDVDPVKIPSSVSIEQIFESPEAPLKNSSSILV